MPRPKAILIKPIDNVATVTEAIPGGVDVTFEKGGMTVTMQVLDSIPMGHKFAVCDITQGEMVRKYGEAIGIATQLIPAGRHAHVHNIESARGRGDRIA